MISKRRTSGCLRVGILAVVACLLAGLPAQGHAYIAKVQPWAICTAATIAAEGVVSRVALLPANGSIVPAGEPVKFSAESTHATTFAVASSEASLSSPDIDSGLGAQSGSRYEYTSTKATVMPRTIYWRASITFTPEDCERPTTFTTPVQTLIVTRSGAELAAAHKQQEEELAKERAAEEAAETQHLASPKALCVVPRLTSKSLAGARRALNQADCRLGAVREPKHAHGDLIVRAQSMRPGSRHRAGTRVAVTLIGRPTNATRRNAHSARPAAWPVVRVMGTLDQMIAG